MEKRVLIVDDDAKLRELLTKYLTGFGFRPRAVASPKEGVAAAQRGEADIVLLDVMLPEMSGFDALKAIRGFSQVPVIMLTARGETADRVLGLELGGDDYLPKPFDPRELVARINAVLRRKAAASPRKTPLSAGGLLLDPSSFSASLDGKALDLTSGEFLTLKALMEHRGAVLSRDQLVAALSGTELGAFDRSMDVMISRLRSKLGDDPQAPRFIKTVRGAGYALLAGAL